MYAPILEIDTRKIEENARKLHTFCALRGVELAFVTKGFSARPGVIRAARAGGVTRFADSRLKNIIAAKTAIPGLHYLLIRIPAIDEAEEVVRWADCSLQSQIEVIRAVSDAAVRQGKIHPIILMVDVGDLREGVFGREQLEEIAGQILGCPGVELVGLGTNVGCYGSILPSVENTRVLVELRDFLNRKYGFHIKTLSGGSTCTLKLLEEGRLPAGINHLRVGEGLLYGEDTTGMRFLEGYHTDAFHFKAQVVELRRKPSVPIGEHGRDGKGELPEYPDRGVHLRAICAAGKQDVAWAALTPTLPGAEMIGASSDHLIVDVEGCGGRVRVGDWLDFRCGYMAVLDATTSAYVDVREVWTASSVGRTKTRAEAGWPPLSFTLSKKPRRVRTRRREANKSRFLQRHVRRRKHFSARARWAASGSKKRRNRFFDGQRKRKPSGFRSLWLDSLTCGPQNTYG